MKLAQIIEAARAANPAAFENTDDKRAVRILRASLRQVSKQLKATREGDVVINGFGRFAVRKVEREKNGVKTTKRRVLFQRGAGKRRSAAGQKKKSKAS